MDYKELKKYGTKLGEKDFNIDGIYSGTKELWSFEESLYLHDYHHNQNSYTGKTDTFYVGKVEDFFHVESSLGFGDLSYMDDTDDMEL